MCACRFEEMQQIPGPIYGDLEEYLSEVENRTTTTDSDDIYTQIRQKEKDLYLAAELGKALLEKNEELSRANELLTEEYSRKLEVLEQEKHHLKRKLDSTQGEYESRVTELNSDMAQLSKDLAEHQILLRSTEQEKSRLLQEFTEQNIRLTTELKQSTKSEEQLQLQLQSMREQFNVRKSNLHDHVSQLEALKEEISFLTERKADLEKRINTLLGDRENLSLSLDESSDRIHMLERQSREQDQLMRNQKRDLEDLRISNLQLQDRLEGILRSPSIGQNSLYNEIEMSSQSSIEDELRSLNESQSGRSRPNSHLGCGGFNGDMDLEIECDEYDLPITGLIPGESEDNFKFRQELATLYLYIQRMCKDLRQRKEFASSDSGISTSPEDIQPQQLRVGMLTAILKELKQLVDESLMGHNNMACSSCQALVAERIKTEKIEKELHEKSEDLKLKTNELSEMTTQLTIQDRNLTATEEERNQLRQDMNDTSLAKDQIVKKAWEIRDQAVARKNVVEIELAKTRIDVMHINSQLMEAIQQKVELSQQLEQWQVDMEALIEDQVVQKLQSQEKKDRKKRTGPSPTQQKLMGQSSPNSNSRTSKLFTFWK